MGGIGIDFEYWRKLPALHVWEVASMMQGYDPRAVTAGEVIVNEYDEGPDLSDEVRRLTSAVMADDITACPPKPACADKSTLVLRTSLVPWLRRCEEYVHLAEQLSTPGQTFLGAKDELPDPARRLARLRSMGGSIVWIRGSNRWKIQGFSALVAAEAAEGRLRISEKTVRADLSAAAQHERDERKAGPFPP